MNSRFSAAALAVLGALPVCGWAPAALAQTPLPPLPDSAPSAAPAPAPMGVPAPPPSAEPGTPPEGQLAPAATSVSQDEDKSWRYRYGVARDRLLAGDFRDAAERFDAVAKEARTPQDRLLAENMRDLARSWADRGLALVKRSVLGESTLPAKSVGERTTDEIASLYTGSVFYGIGTGLWFDVHVGPTTSGAVILPLVLASGMAVGTVALLDVGHPLKYGVPSSILAGMGIGFEEGLVLSLWNVSQSDSSTHWQGTTAADVIWGLSTVGAVGGGVLGATLGATPGRASFVESAALWTGVVAGLATSALTSSSDQDRAANSLLGADVGMNLGGIGGLLGAGPVSPSLARVSFLNLGAIGGGLLSGALYLAAAGNNSDARAGCGITALGIAGGVGIAWAATARMAPDRLEPELQQAHASLQLAPLLVPVRGGATIGVHGTL